MEDCFIDLPKILDDELFGTLYADEVEEGKNYNILCFVLMEDLLLLSMIAGIIGAVLSGFTIKGLTKWRSVVFIILDECE